MVDLSGINGYLDSLPSWIENIKSFDYLWLLMLLMPYLLVLCVFVLFYAFYRWNKERE